MGVTSTNFNTTNSTLSAASKPVKDKTVLGKDDFLKLLLVELQHQDPTEPMDSEKILSQTSQLATLEASQNTNDSLDGLSKSLASSQEFSIIAAIGKRADLGSNAISLQEGSSSTFELYFPESVASGTIEMSDSDGNVVGSISIELPEGEDSLSSGVYKYTWDGKDVNGNNVDGGIYHVNAKYTDTKGTNQTTKIGAYPIESVRFEDGKALVKLGSNYVPLKNIAEVY